MNQITIIGRVGKDADLKTYQNGCMCTFTVATSEKWKDAQGEAKEHTDWHNIVSNGKQAETLAKWVKKGMLIMISGKVKYSSYENKEGQKVYTTNIICNSFEFLSKSDVQANSVNKTHYPTNNGSVDNSFSNIPSAANEEDLPF